MKNREQISTNLLQTTGEWEFHLKAFVGEFSQMSTALISNVSVLPCFVFPGELEAGAEGEEQPMKSGAVIP